MADDDPEDCMMAKEALEEARLANELRFVEDGEELMHYLRREETTVTGSIRRGQVSSCWI